MSDDWYKRNPVDFLDGIVKLSLEEVGAYTILLDTIYALDRPLVDDDRYIAGLLRCHVLKWKAIKRKLLKGPRPKLFQHDGMLDNRRAKIERDRRDILRRKRANAGHKGGSRRGRGEVGPGSGEVEARSSGDRVRLVRG